MFSRREVMKNVAIGTACNLFLPNSLGASAKPQKEKSGIVLVGLDYYSTDILAPALQSTEKCYLADVVTSTPAKGEAL
jgi:glucose-fructose oxidoreductase